MRILEQLGFIAVDNVRSNAQAYVHYFNPEGVLKGLSCIPDYIKKVTSISDNDKRELRGFLANMSFNCNNGILVQLPIFETFPTLNEPHSGANRWVSGGRSAQGYRGQPCVPLPMWTRVIDLHNEVTSRLGQRAEVKLISEEELFSQYILPNFDQYTNDQRIKITKHLLQNLESYTGIEGKLKTINCIPITTGGTFKSPGEIFDPTDRRIKELFGEFDLLPFPKQPFTDEVLLIKLRRLGMGGIDNIQAEHLLKLSQHVHKHASRANRASKVRKQGKALSTFLNERHDFLNQ